MTDDTTMVGAADTAVPGQFNESEIFARAKSSGFSVLTEDIERSAIQATTTWLDKLLEMNPQERNLFAQSFITEAKRSIGDNKYRFGGWYIGCMYCFMAETVMTMAQPLKGAYTFQFTKEVVLELHKVVNTCNTYAQVLNYYETVKLKREGPDL